MAHLTAESLFADGLPERWAGALNAMAELHALGADSATGDDPRLRERAGELYEQLLSGAEAYSEPIPAALQADTPLARSWFVEAVVLWTWFNRAGSAPLVDTIGCRTLELFPLDLPFCCSSIARVKEAARRASGLDLDEFASVVGRVRHLTGNLVVKNQICEVFASHLESGQNLSPAGRVVVFQQFYGPVPFRPGDVDWLVTSTSIFPCIPREKNRLLVDDFATRPPEERQQLTRFMERLRDANIANSDRFPSFGLYPDELEPALVEMICRGVDAPRAVVLATLRTMVMVLPTQAVDQYVVHDVWGHTWQEALGEFEWEYALAPRIAEALGPETGPAFGADAAFISCFTAQGGGVVVDLERLIAIAEQDLRGRLQVGTSIALSELFADFMESKFARAVPDGALPTSSLLDVSRLKLDLSIGDLRRQVRLAGRPYRRLATDSEVRGGFEAALAAAGLPERGRRVAVESAAAALWERFGSVLDSSLESRSLPGPAGVVQSSALRRLGLQMMLIARELDQALERAQSAEAAEVSSSADLLLVAAAHLYEQDRQRNLWHIDQVLREVWPRLSAAMDAELAPCGEG